LKFCNLQFQPYTNLNLKHVLLDFVSICTIYHIHDKYNCSSLAISATTACHFWHMLLPKSCTEGTHTNANLSSSSTTFIFWVTLWAAAKSRVPITTWMGFFMYDCANRWTPADHVVLQQTIVTDNFETFAFSNMEYKKKVHSFKNRISHSCKCSYHTELTWFKELQILINDAKVRASNSSELVTKYNNKCRSSQNPTVLLVLFLLIATKKKTRKETRFNSNRIN